VVGFGPSVEISTSNPAFLIEQPLTLLKEGRFNHVPWIAGTTQDEGLLFHAFGK